MIHFEEVNQGNWRLDLSVAPEQRNYVSEPYTMYARAWAYRTDRSQAYVIYDQKTPVGACLYHDCPEMEAYDLSQLLIDHCYQGRGYGKEATRLLLEEMRRDGRYQKVVLCYIEGNEAARRLYEGFGFRETDRDEDEIVMELML